MRAAAKYGIKILILCIYENVLSGLLARLEWKLAFIQMLYVCIRQKDGEQNEYSSRIPLLENGTEPLITHYVTFQDGGTKKLFSYEMIEINCSVFRVTDHSYRNLNTL